MSETTTNPLAEIRAAHVLCTHSSLRPGGINLHKAGCSCGARYDWYTREAEHAEHQDAMILEHFAAREAAARREALLEAAAHFTARANAAHRDDLHMLSDAWDMAAADLREFADPERDEEGGRG